MKLHPPILRVCVETLYAVFVENRYAEKLVDYHLKNQKKWGARDRRQFATLIYDMVRWWRLIAHLAGVDQQRLPWPGHAQRITLTEFQVLIEGMIHFYLENEVDIHEIVLGEVCRAVRLSIPDELDAWGESQFAENWEPLIKALNKSAPVYLRTNLLKTDRLNLQTKLKSEGVETEIVAEVESALKLKERKNVFTTQAFKAGLFEMQDAGSQQVAPLLDVEPGMRVVDCCAGAGGKTLHLASLMKNKGQIIALDVHEGKLKELKNRAKRAGANIIETRCIENNKTIKRLFDSADRVLMDVPCSGLGVLRRHPDTKWHFDLQAFQETLKLQSEILESYVKMLRVGGKMVYATCSVVPAENQSQIESFLRHHKECFTPENELHISPINTDFDGFYAARLYRIR